MFKRGIYGTFHHIGQQHLKRYLAESDFRYNDRSALGINDKMRAAKAVKGVVGKRLTYHRPDEAAYAYAKGAQFPAMAQAFPADFDPKEIE